MWFSKEYTCGLNGKPLALLETTLDLQSGLEECRGCFSFEDERSGEWSGNETS